VLAGLIAGAGSRRGANARDAGLKLLAARSRVSQLPFVAELWAFNGEVPGPLLRARQGHDFKVRVHNDLSEPISVHWHGVRVANAMDGTSLTQAPIMPGGFFDYGLTPPDAGTFWYHTATNNSVQRERGLHGMLIVEEGKAEGAGFDVPMVIDDWKLNAAGELDEAAFADPAIAAGAGRIGDRFTVNGIEGPVLKAPAGDALRLRLLNAANAQILALRLDGGELWVIAHDGQPTRPMRLADGTRELVPGQRLDVSVAPSAAPLTLSAVLPGGPVVLATIAREGPQSEPVHQVPPLEANPLPDYFNYASLHQVSFTIEGGRGGGLTAARHQGAMLSAGELSARGLAWAVNGQAGLGPEPLFSLPRGVTVAVTVDNITRVPHVLHIHGHAAKLVEVSGRPVADPVWRDTFIAWPLEPAKFLFIADNPGRWLIASAIAEHFDSGVQAWFEVR
jgi:FtsP/CotA-like multicopper oxidase with cupredoxin domain